MKFRVVTVRDIKPHIVVDRYPVLNEYGIDGGVIDIESADELTQLARKIKMPMILYGHSCYGPKGAGLLEIYDEYRE